MRHCYNEHVECYEASGDDLAVLLRDAADTLDGLEHLWADFKVTCHFDDDYEHDFTLSMDVH